MSRFAPLSFAFLKRVALAVSVAAAAALACAAAGAPGAIAADGDVIGLLAWRVPGRAPFLLPRIEGQSPEVTARRYLDGFAAAPAYSSHSHTALAVHELGKAAVPGAFSLVDPRPDARKPLPMAFVTNHPMQLTSDNSYIPQVEHAFRSAYARPYGVPLGLEASLTPEQLGAYHRQLRRFPLLLLVGGDDLDPAWAGTDPHVAYGVTPERDAVEIALARDYRARGEGCLWGICRGSQLLGHLLGMPMVSNIDESITPIPHRAGAEGFARVPVRLTDRHNPIWRWTDEMSFDVPAWHHQAVKGKGNDRIRPIASENGRVVMATEFTDGRGGGVQWHPETWDMKLPRNQDVVNGMVEEARRRAGLPARLVLRSECKAWFRALQTPVRPAEVAKARPRR